MRQVLILMGVVFVLISLAASDMPESFYKAMAGMKNQDILCVKNYDAGASVTRIIHRF